MCSTDEDLSSYGWSVAGVGIISQCRNRNLRLAGVSAGPFTIPLREPPGRGAWERLQAAPPCPTATPSLPTGSPAVAAMHRNCGVLVGMSRVSCILSDRNRSFSDHIV